MSSANGTAAANARAAATVAKLPTFPNGNDVVMLDNCEWFRELSNSPTAGLTAFFLPCRRQVRLLSQCTHRLGVNAASD